LSRLLALYGGVNFELQVPQLLIIERERRARYERAVAAERARREALEEAEADALSDDDAQNEDGVSVVSEPPPLAATPAPRRRPMTWGPGPADRGPA
jgi:hypothetical protein